MADLNTNIDVITNDMAGIEDRVNEYHDAASPATYFGRHATACEGLVWGYYGFVVNIQGDSPDLGPTRIPNGTLTLDASSTCYIERTFDGSVSFNTTGFTAGRIPGYIATTGTDTVTDYKDCRGLPVMPSLLATGAAHSVDDVITLLQNLGLCKQA